MPLLMQEGGLHWLADAFYVHREGDDVYHVLEASPTLQKNPCDYDWFKPLVNIMRDLRRRKPPWTRPEAPNETFTCVEYACNSPVSN